MATVDAAPGISQQTAAAASNVPAATEEQTFSIFEASENIQRPAPVEELQDAVSDFDTEAGAGPAVGTSTQSTTATDSDP